MKYPFQRKKHWNKKNIELKAWKDGIPVNKQFKVLKLNHIVGAKWGKETKYMRIEYTQGAIHGHPISKKEYDGYLK